jgi:hypothetical protein
MLTAEERTRRAVDLLREPPSLQNGDRLRSQEFLRHYKAMPELKKAELIEGIVSRFSGFRQSESGVTVDGAAFEPRRDRLSQE